MKGKILLTISVFTCYYLDAQIWEYPPKHISNWQENETIPKDSLVSIKVWNYEIIDGKETGKRELKFIQEFDSLGNTISLTYGVNGTPIIFDMYVNGYWQLKIVNGKSIYQNIVFDSAGNVIRQSIKDLVWTFEYDSLNRPIKKEGSNEIHLWNYDEEKLKSYQLYKNGILKENRTYYYDSLKHSVSYSTYFFDANGVMYAVPDSVSGYFSSGDSLTRIESYSYDTDQWDTLVLTFNFIEDKMVYEGSDYCQAVQTFRNEKGNKEFVVVYNCDGIIEKKTSFEYVYEN